MTTAEEFRPAGSTDFASVQEERRLGRLPVLIVRMNADLAMGEALLKKTGSGNLFTVFGEPDVRIDETSEGIVVEILGLDVYNPTTGEIPLQRHRRHCAVDGRHRRQRRVLLRVALLFLG